MKLTFLEKPSKRVITNADGNCGREDGRRPTTEIEIADTNHEIDVEEKIDLPSNSI